MARSCLAEDRGNLGASGLKVPVLSFGTGTFGGQGPLFSAWGRSGVDEARRLIDICLEENQRRLAGYDRRLLRPAVMPCLVRLIRRFLRQLQTRAAALP